MTRISLQPNAMPIELRHLDQWVAWGTRSRDGALTKVPLDPADGRYASTADPETWGCFDTALGAVRRPDVTGIGFVFTDCDSYVGVDLDDCRVPEAGTLTEPAAEICDTLGSYTEVSPSGTGVHVIVRGTLPAGARRRGSVELYETGRFFTMTGARVVGTPAAVAERPAALQGVHRRHVAQSVEAESAGGTSTSTTAGGDRIDRPLTFATDLDDHTLLSKAQSAANGAKFTALWRGETSGYDSHSEADMALCCLLAFWTGHDHRRMDALFRDSGLYREKWDAVHYADGATYGERTVERATRHVTDAFEP
jgi:primase-polymerase (primpol)-like protein